LDAILSKDLSPTLHAITQKPSEDRFSSASSVTACRRFSPLHSYSRIRTVSASSPCSGSILRRRNGVNARSRGSSKGYFMCVSGIISVANVLMSPDADYNAQDTYDRAMPDRRAFGLSSVYKSFGSSNAGVTSPDNAGGTITGKTTSRRFRDGSKRA